MPFLMATFCRDTCDLTCIAKGNIEESLSGGRAKTLFLDREEERGEYGGEPKR